MERPDRGALSDHLVEFAVDRLSALGATVAPGLALPTTLAGHQVAHDAVGDLAYTLGLLRRAGVAAVDDVDVTQATRAALHRIDGRSADSFTSYRVAETIDALGGLEAAAPDAEDRENLALACDSTSLHRALEKSMVPANYAVVLARCEWNRHRLGLVEDRTDLADLFDRAGALLADGWFDDSGSGFGMFDIYSADAYLFAEPFAAEIPGWREGFGRVIGDLGGVAARNGAAVTWGRSLGLLSVCLTIEIGAVSAARGLPGAQRWLALADHAADRLDDWFDRRTGLVTSYHHRSPWEYRGPQRWMQLTLDALGKLVQSALWLREANDPQPEPVAWPSTSRLVRTGGTSAVWVHRSPGLAFSLPFGGGAQADYLAAPRNPGLFEVPVDSPLASLVPVVTSAGTTHAPSGPPRTVTRDDATGSVTAEQPFAVIDGQAGDDRLTGTRVARHVVEGRRLTVEEDLTFDRAPSSLHIAVPEVPDRPLRVAVDGPEGARIACVPTEGMADHRSFWGPLPRTHQIEVPPAASVTFSWSVTRPIRVTSTAHGHWYHDCLYGPLDDDVALVAPPVASLGNPRALAEALSGVDVLHMHWPEWFTGNDPGHTARVIDAVVSARCRIVWTQHNLVPHAIPGADAYPLWAEAADVVIHHTEWSRDRAVATYAYGPHTTHAVIQHGHWLPLMEGFDELDRASIERDLGLSPCAIRLGIVGAPRAAKDVQAVIDAVAACSRDDIGLVVWSLADEDVPDDERIAVHPYEEIPRAEYDRRLKTLDAVVLPFDDTMLTTGTVGDVIGAGIPAITSEWGYLAEALGAAAIPYGRTAADLTATLEALDASALDAARAASIERRESMAWAAIAPRFLAVLDALPADKV